MAKDFTKDFINLSNRGLSPDHRSELYFNHRVNSLGIRPLVVMLEKGFPIDVVVVPHSLPDAIKFVHPRQRNRGRIENVSGHLVHSIIGDLWNDLSERKQYALVSESMPKLRKTYEEYLWRGYQTKEAAEIAIKKELERLSKKYLKCLLVRKMLMEQVSYSTKVLLS
jgi:hypothetical protein